MKNSKKRQWMKDVHGRVMEKQKKVEGGREGTQEPRSSSNLEDRFSLCDGEKENKYRSNFSYNIILIYE